MAVSSKSIIHYTKSLANLKGIIKDGALRTKYCNERLVFNDDGKSFASFAFPMASFCDLPLSSATKHIDKYGSYGIGFTKEWAHNRRLNPVLYLETNSVISAYLLQKIKDILLRTIAADNADEANDVKEVDAKAQQEASNKLEELYDLSRILGFCKNHKGDLIRKNKKSVPDYIFYDEREWRYVPDKEGLKDTPLMLTSNKYEKDKQGYNAKLRNNTLKFSYEDISYIIVKNQNDISPIVDCLYTKYKDGAFATSLNQIYTKIITVSQIRNDF